MNFCAIVFVALTSTQPADVSRLVHAKQQVFTPLWHAPVVRTGFDRKVTASFGTPAIVAEQGLIIAAGGEGDVRALRLNDGQTLWRYVHGAPFEGPVSLVARKGKLVALVTAKDGKLLAIDTASGQLVWQTSLGADSAAPALVTTTQIYLTSTNHRLFSIDLENGSIVWSKGRNPPVGLSIFGHAAASLYKNLIVTSFSDGYAQAFRVEDGSSAWQRPLSLKGGEFADADADPIVDDNDVVYFASHTDGVHALSAKDGSLQWTFAARGIASLARDETHLYAASSEGFVWALESATGKRVYKVRMNPGAVTRLLLHRGYLVFGAGSSNLTVLNASEGKPLQALAVGGRILGDINWAAGHLAFITDVGELFVFRENNAPVSMRPSAVDDAPQL